MNKYMKKLLLIILSVILIIVPTFAISYDYDNYDYSKAPEYSNKEYMIPTSEIDSFKYESFKNGFLGLFGDEYSYVTIHLTAKGKEMLKKGTSKFKEMHILDNGAFEGGKCLDSKDITKPITDGIIHTSWLSDGKGAMSTAVNYNKALAYGGGVIIVFGELKYPPKEKVKETEPTTHREITLEKDLTKKVVREEKVNETTKRPIIVEETSKINEIINAQETSKIIETESTTYKTELETVILESNIEETTIIETEQVSTSLSTTDLNKFYDDIKKSKTLRDTSATQQFDTVTFGRYYINNDTLEPLEWIVVMKENGIATLMTKNVIDAMTYEEFLKDDNGNNWLQTTFKNTAFNDTEKSILNVKDNEASGIHFLDGWDYYQYLESGGMINRNAIAKPTAYVSSKFVIKGEYQNYVYYYGASDGSLVSDQGIYKKGRYGFTNEYIGFRPCISVRYE